MKSFSIAAVALCCALLSVPASAQVSAAVPAQPSAGGTPVQTPFSPPYGAPVSLDRAAAALQGAETEAERRGWPTSIAVVDTHGELVDFSRMDGAMLASPSIAQNKARTAARYRRDTRVFFNAYMSGSGYVTTFGADLVAAPGGIPLLADGKLVGAIGCSGGTGDQDAVVCQAGVDAFK